MPRSPGVILNHKAIESIRGNDWDSVVETLRRLGLNTFNGVEEQRVQEYLKLRRDYMSGEVPPDEFDQRSREFADRIIEENGDERFFESRKGVLGVISRALSKN